MTAPAVITPAILLDLDGTLVDPEPGITSCIRYALEAMGQPDPGAEALHWAVGPPLWGSFAKLLGTEERAVLDRAVALYRERYVPTGRFETTPYPGAGEALQALRAAGCRLFLATSKPHVFARDILTRFGLADHFAGIFGPELDGRLANKVELVAHLIRAVGLAPASAWMVGDRAEDIRAGCANGLQAAGALWGYGSRQELAEAGAVRLLDSPRALTTLLAA
jgi:phosphoglycolate phosphatase